MHLSRTAGTSGVGVQPALSEAATVLGSAHAVVVGALVTVRRPEDEGVADGQVVVATRVLQAVLDRVGRLFDPVPDADGLKGSPVAPVRIARVVAPLDAEAAGDPRGQLGARADAEFDRGRRDGKLLDRARAVAAVDVSLW